MKAKNCEYESRNMQEGEGKSLESSLWKRDFQIQGNHWEIIEQGSYESPLHCSYTGKYVCREDINIYVYPQTTQK